MNLGAVSLDPTGIPGSYPITTIQKTVMKVDEEGAKGAAVTGGWATSNGDNSKPREVEITFDRPFMFFIENVETGSILMAGRICNL